MNIKIPTDSNSINQPQAEKKIIEKIDTNLEQLVFTQKAKQFKFDCGMLMGRIDVPLDSKFGLQYYYTNTKSFEEFIEKIKEVLAFSDNVMSDSDYQKLEKQWNNYHKKMAKS